MTSTPIAQQRAFLEGSKVAGGVAGIPTSYYRKALDLNRFSNTVANKLLESYRRQIVKAVRELERIDRMPSSKRPEFKAARMRALIKQNLDSMRSWSKQSTEDLIKQLDGLADVEVSFARNELAKVLPAQMQTSVRSVEVTESFAKALVEADPLDVGSNLLKQNIDEAVKGPGALLKLTARQGAIIRMPNGKSIAKSFRGLAEAQGELFSRTVLDGLLTGESTASIARSLYGELGFSTEALTARQIALAQKGNAWKMAKHQVRTLVQTSVNATSNAASMAVFKANPDITKQYRWVATLDSRTTPICRNLDQNVYEYGKGPTPANPPHFRCRSTTIPVVDWEGLGIDPPPNEQGYRPTKESKPNSAKPDGGRVPVDTSAASHIYGLRANTKSGSKSRFEPSAAQARMLGGGKDTPASRQKARYFNRLADRYGPDGAMQRFMREDGSEVSLKQLQARYGDPAKITAAKTKAKPKPKPKPKTKVKPAAAAAPKPKAAASAPPKPEKVSADVQRSFVESHVFGQKQKITPQDLADTFELASKDDSEAGRNFGKMLEFMRRKNISTVWSNGREKTFGKGPNFDHWKNQTLIQSMRDGIARAPGERGAAFVGAIADNLEQGKISPFLDKLGKVNGRAAGHTINGGGFIVIKQTSKQVKIRAKELQRTKNAVVASVEAAAKGTPKFVTNSDLYVQTGKATVGSPDGWLTTIVHEVGHQVHYNAGKTNISNFVLDEAKKVAGYEDLSPFQRDRLLDSLAYAPTKYGATNGLEQFAESFVQYVFAPAELRKASPATYNWVDTLMEEGLK